MILWTLLSLALAVVLAVFDTLLSGYALHFLFGTTMPLFLFACVLLLLCVCGFAKSALVPFYTKRRLEKCTLAELKRADLFFASAVKLGALFALFAASVAAVPFMYAWIHGPLTNTGPNLAVVIESPLYASLFILVLLPLKARVKNLRIGYMYEAGDTHDFYAIQTGEANDAGGGTGANETQSRSGGNGKHLRTVLQAAGFAAWTAAALFILLVSFTRLDEKIGLPVDVPSFLKAVLPALSALLAGGQFRNFARALAECFGGKKTPVAQHEKNIDALSLVKRALVAGGVLATSINFAGIFCNLEDRAAIPSNFYVAMLPMLYALFLALVLECMGAKLKAE